MRIHTPREIGLLVRKQRRSYEWSQQQLALSIGISRQWVAAIELGKPGVAIGLTLRALNALEIHIELLPPEQPSAGSDVPATGVTTHIHQAPPKPAKAKDVRGTTSSGRRVATRAAVGRGS